MPSTYYPGGSKNRSDGVDDLAPRQSMECQLFESLVYHLIEKGILTNNDALSVVQTVAEVKRGELEEGRFSAAITQRAIDTLAALYSSFELRHDRTPPSDPVNSENIVRLRPPLHGDEPHFPRDD